MYSQPRIPQWMLMLLLLVDTKERQEVSCLCKEKTPHNVFLCTAWSHALVVVFPPERLIVKQWTWTGNGAGQKEGF